MIFTAMRSITKVVDYIMFHSLVKFHNFWISGLEDINVLPKTRRIEDRFLSLNGTDDLDSFIFE
jgi:hypothetical protein